MSCNFDNCTDPAHFQYIRIHTLPTSLIRSTLIIDNLNVILQQERDRYDNNTIRECKLAHIQKQIDRLAETIQDLEPSTRNEVIKFVEAMQKQQYVEANSIATGMVQTSNKDKNSITWIIGLKRLVSLYLEPIH